MSKTIQPKILKDYSIIKELGSGAYGYVWEVKCKQTQKKYALKKIFDAFRNQVDAQRTYRQVQFLSKIDNQFIIKPQRFFPSKNKKDLFILFEFMEADLQIANHLNVLQRNHLIFVFYQILLGLDHLHDRNLIHRDLKPSNVLIDDSSKIKICDFGLIRSHKSNEIQQTVLTDEIATKWYRAPQVLLGSKRYSNKIDIWSFGCIVSELLTKKVAFPGNTTFDQFQLMLQFNGPLSQTDKQSLKLQSTQNLQKLISPISQKQFQTYFSQVSKQFYPLLRNTLQINPKKRMSTKQLLKLPLFDQFRKSQFETVCQQIPFQFELNDNKMFQICQYRQKIQEISTVFNSKKQTELRQYQEQKIEYQQKNKENKKIQQANNNKQRKQIKRNSKSLNQDEKKNKKAVTQSKNFSVLGVIRSKKVITMPKIKSLQKKHQILQNNRKSFQQFKGNSFTFGKQSTNNKSTPYLNHQKLIKKPIQNMGFPFKSIQNRTDTLMKKSFHNCFSNQTKMFFSQQNQQSDLKGEPIYRNNAYTKHDQKRQLYIYSNWITQSIYGKQNKPKKY